MSEYKLRPDMAQELKKAYSVEIVQNPGILADLPKEFYKNLRDWLLNASDPEREEIEVLIQKLMRMRIGKLIEHGTVCNVRDIASKLADEESEFVEKIRKTTIEFQKKIFEMTRKRPELE